MIYDVVIVGAGAAGIGCGVVLQDLGMKRFLILERANVGASFDAWPEEMRFITPSFTSNAFGMLDLNAIALATSPAFTLKVEHPSGREYARYLRGVAAYFKLPIKGDCAVQKIERESRIFILHTSQGKLSARFVIWAAGEFQYPDLNPFPGAEHCIHSAQISKWSEIAGEESLVIGGYESGVDAAVHLSQYGKRVTVLDSRSPWKIRESDPSVALSPYTRERLAKNQSVELVGKARVLRVERSNSHFTIFGKKGQCWTTPNAPILATGFRGSLSLVHDFFEWDERGQARLTDCDESTRVPGIFVAGPQVRHEKVIFCFIYKFRQRFAVIGQAVGKRLGLSTKPLDPYRQQGMFLEDLSCCKAKCQC